MTLIQLHNDHLNRIITIGSDSRITGYNYFYYSIPKKYKIFDNKLAIGACGYEIIINYIRHELEIADSKIEALEYLANASHLTEENKVSDIVRLLNSSIIDPLKELIDKQVNKEIPFEILVAINKYSFSIDSGNLYLSNRLNDEYMCCGANSGGLAAYKMLKRQKPLCPIVDTMMEVFQTVAEYNYSVAAPYSIDQISY